jgi:hypothetical protein
MERRKARTVFTSGPRLERIVFYAQFRDENGVNNTAISTGCGNRDEAVRWREKRLKNGTKQQTGTTSREYADGFLEARRGLEGITIRQG